MRIGLSAVGIVLLLGGCSKPSLPYEAECRKEVDRARMRHQVWSSDDDRESEMAMCVKCRTGEKPGFCNSHDHTPHTLP